MAPSAAIDELVDDFHRQVVESLEEGVYYVDRERRIEYWNNGSAAISGYAGGDVVGRRCYDNILNHVDDAGNVLCNTSCPLAATIADGRPREVSVYLRHREGHRVPVRVRASAIRDAEGRIIGAAEVFSDTSPILMARAEADRYRQLSLIDDLTGLPNRRAVEDAIDVRLASLARYGWPFGLLMIDVDDFKGVNDTYGHAVGDIALRTVAHTMRNACRSDDFVGRWGGDEFLALVTVDDQAGLQSTMERIRSLVARSDVEAGTSRFQLSVSVGGAIAAPGDRPESLLAEADQGLYRDKAGRTAV